jgi:hypothetical protein
VQPVMVLPLDAVAAIVVGRAVEDDAVAPMLMPRRHRLTVGRAYDLAGSAARDSKRHPHFGLPCRVAERDATLPPLKTRAFSTCISVCSFGDNVLKANRATPLRMVAFTCACRMPVVTPLPGQTNSKPRSGDVVGIDGAVLVGDASGARDMKLLIVNGSDGVRGRF